MTNSRVRPNKIINYETFRLCVLYNVAVMRRNTEPLCRGPLIMIVFLIVVSVSERNEQFTLKVVLNNTIGEKCWKAVASYLWKTGCAIKIKSLLLK